MKINSTMRISGNRNHFASAIAKGFDSDCYSNLYTDIQKVYGDNAAPDVLLGHYLKYGVSEGRVPNQLGLREHMVTELKKRKSILEIGPFTNPMVVGENVKYFDVLDKAGLIERATAFGRATHTAVDIDFVDPNGDLSVVDVKFDTVLSSHCIEHQPNLVSHLQRVGDVLEPKGSYYVICPDKRYCFDHFIPETTTIDVLVADKEKRTSHTLQKVVEHKTIVTHNNPKRHWAGDHGVTHYPKHGHDAIEKAFKTFDDADGSYIDVHAWQFTPGSFVTVMSELCEFGYTNLYVDIIYPTPKSRFEFIAILKVVDR